MKPIQVLILILTGLLMTAGCGEDKSETRNDSPVAMSSIPDKTMCELITKETMSSITGIKFTEESSTLHQTDAKTGKYVSQCGYTTEGAQMVILVRRFGDTPFPTEKENIVGGQKTGDKDLDEMMEKSIETARRLTGPGDGAYFYEMGGINSLVVRYDKHYQIRITSYGKGFGFDDKTLEVSKKVAEKVIDILK